MNGLRPAMRWLHNWSGMVLGWLLFAIFVTGSCGYFRHEITLFMTPELRALNDTDVPQQLAAQRALDWLGRNAAQADNWVINLPDEKSPALRVAWSGVNTGSQLLDPQTGHPLTSPPRETGGGDFLYRLHSDLHFVSPMVGRIAVSFLAVMLLTLLVTGIVTHRHILRNLFRLRRGKGWRTRLDLHNMTGVLGLPFHLMLVISGLVTVMMLLQPWGVVSVYGAGGLGAFAQEAFPASTAGVAPAGVESGRIDPSIARLINGAKQRWNVDDVGEIQVAKPETPQMTVTIAHPIRGMLSMRKPSVTFDPIAGAVVGSANEDLSSVSTLHTQIFGLHVAHFAGPVLRPVLFALGLVGSAMIATGLLLWTDKRRDRFTQGRQQGKVALCDRINAAVIVGLPIAIGAYLWSNRIIDADASGRAVLEQQVMFLAWALAFGTAFTLPARLLWPVLCMISGAMLATVGMVDLLESHPVLVIDVFLLATGAAFVVAAVYRRSSVGGLRE